MSSTIRRRAAALLGASAFAAGALGATASPAGASVDPAHPHHSCMEFFGMPDDGPLSDPVHHSVEPLLPILDNGNDTQSLGCIVWSVEESLRCPGIPILLGICLYR
jgi:hypothetical protein